MYLNLRMSIVVFKSYHEKMEFKAYGEIVDPDQPAHRATWSGPLLSAYKISEHYRIEYPYQTVCLRMHVCAFVLSRIQVQTFYKNRLQQGKDYDFLFQTVTHLCHASHKKDIDKQCRTWSDATERGVRSRPTVFELNIGFCIKHGNNKTLKPLLEMDWNKELR